MIYDVAVVGAGPAGLMAAQTASQKGLQVILLEKFKDISTIRRACCQQLVMDEHYENEDIQITPEKILFPNNGFAVNYDGPAYPITATSFVSPSGRTVHFSYADKRPVAIKIDKGLLLKTLLETCRSSGVVIHDNTTAYHARDAGGHFGQLHRPWVDRPGTACNCSVSGTAWSSSWAPAACRWSGAATTRCSAGRWR